MSPSDPEIFGRFTLLELLGEGGMGCVYRAAIDGPSGFRKELALKVLRDDARRDPERRAAGLAKEARIGALLRHPNLVDLYDYGVHEERPWFSMELVPGRPLDRLLAEEGPLVPIRAVSLLSQIALGLAAIHELEIEGQPAGLVHRDLKPANVLVTRDDHVKVADFGISRGRHELIATQNEDLCGTPSYMSPEQAREGELTAKSDLFALGLIGWELITGQRLLQGASLFEVMFALLRVEERQDELRALDSELPGLGSLLAQCLREDPAARPASARSVRGQLLALELRRFVASAPAWTATTVGADVVEPDPDEPLSPSGNLRAGVDAFVGRARELSALRAALGPSGRVVSVLGPGGTGKTRLVQELGLALRGEFPAGVWFVDLTEARTRDGVCSDVAQALDIPLARGVENPPARIGAALSGRGRMLLLLDNFEQVAAFAADTVGAWAQSCLQVRFAVTTRQRLGLGAEHLVRIGPLSTSFEPGLSLDQLRALPAIQLFVDRARLRRPDFDLDEANAATVAELVRALDGIPLAIELAAARVRVLSPARLLERLPERFDLLSTGRTDVTGRQATLRATIEWSWNLLEPWERAGLAQSAVFRGGFTAEAAEAVFDLSAWPQAPWVLDVVQALEDKSLLRSVPAASGEVRFVHYESIREFARDKLEAADERRAAEARHVSCFAAKGHQDALDALSTKGSSARRQRLREDLENLAVAAERARETGRWSEACDATLAATTLLSDSGPLDVALRMLGLVLERPELPSLSRARACILRSLVRSLQADNAGATQDLREAERLAHEAGDVILEATAWSELGRLEVYRPEEGQTELLERARAVFVRAGDRLREGRVLCALAIRAGVLGRVHRARARNEEALVMVKRTGDRMSELVALANLAIAYKELSMGVLELATLNEALRLSRELGARRHEAVLLVNLGVHHQCLGRLRRAEELYRDALARCREIGLLDLEELALANIGDVLKEQGRFEEAVGPISAAIERSDRRADLRFRPGVLLMFAQVLIALDRLDEADEVLEEAAELAPALGNPRHLGEAHTWRGAWHRARGEFVAARRALDEAEATLEEVPEARYRLRAQVERAAVELDAGAPERSRALCADALEDARAVQDPLLLALLLATQGRAERGVGDSAACEEARAELAETLDGLELAPGSPLLQALAELRA